MNKLSQRWRYIELRTLGKREVILLRDEVLELSDTAIAYIVRQSEGRMPRGKNEGLKQGWKLLAQSKLLQSTHERH